MFKRVLCLFTIIILFQSLSLHRVFAIAPAMQDMATENQVGQTTNLGSFNTDDLSRKEYSLTTQIYGGLPGVKFDVKTDPSTYYGTGLLPATIGYTAALMNRPIRTSEYVADVLHNVGIAAPVYAQGMGFSGLTTILQIWKGFRNVAYFVFIILFVIVGFMIMFRKKVSSNAVATIQESLPKLIVTLLLITFSYAIAGLVIDFMYLIIFVMLNVFAGAGIITDAKTATDTLMNHNIIGIGLSYFTGFSEPAGQAASAIGNLVGQVVGSLIGTGANVLFYLIFLVAVLIAIFRTFVQLVIAYVSIILSTIFAPLQLLPNALPGNDAFAKWFQGLIANAAVFPVACAFVVLGVVLAGNNLAGPAPAGLTPSTTDYTGFFPPLLYGMADSGGSVNAARALIGFAMIMLLPEIIKLTHEALEYKTPWFGEAATKHAQSGNFIVGGASLAGRAIESQLTIGNNNITTWPTKIMSSINSRAEARRNNREEASELNDRLESLQSGGSSPAAGNTRNTIGGPPAYRNPKSSA